MSAPDIINEKAFYHDIADNPVNCNIYHPKYGYPGFVQDSYSFVLTSYNPTIYKDPQTNQTVYCRYYLEVLCLHEDGTYFNKDGHQIVMVPFTLSGQTRPASNDADLEEIYQRELSKKGLANKGEEYSLLLKAELIEHTQELVRLYKELFSYTDRDLNLILLADKFICYLSEESKQFSQNTMTPKKLTKSPTYDATSSATLLTDNTSVADSENTKPRKEQMGKKKRHAEYCEEHANFKAFENMTDVEAAKAVAKKHGVHLDTVERALGWRK